jgi:hypothetical protein
VVRSIAASISARIDAMSVRAAASGTATVGGDSTETPVSVSDASSKEAI